MSLTHYMELLMTNQRGRLARANGGAPGVIQR